MLSVIACVSDGLLKLRLTKLLSAQNRQFSITDKPIKRDDATHYDVTIIHSTYRMTELYHFIENVVIQKLTTVIYITSNVNSNPFRKFVNHTHLIFVDENKMDIELPLALELIDKQKDQIQHLANEKIKLERQIKELNTMNRCKRMLMHQGLTEEEAHQKILKFAMDNHIDKIEACNRLLDINSE
ncbi:MAG TPA: hypothetical protein PKU69_01155 [Bacillota bacterium]|nr:hypothetical protein [Bacillota bacterium]